MRMSTLASLGVALGVILGMPAHADTDNGKRLAERWCASCHLVAQSQRQATPDVAPFAAIARMPDFDAGKLAYFLLAPHPLMPDMSLSRQEAADLAAYILAQGR